MGGEGGDGEVRPTRSSSSSSSGEEDGDANWKAAIDSIASVTIPSTTKDTSSSRNDDTKSREIKHYQIKALKLLEEMLDKSIEVVSDPTEDVISIDHVVEESGVRLFRTAPSGIVFDHHMNMIQGPKKRPRLVPSEEIDEKSSKFRKRLQSVVVDGNNIIASARESQKRSLARREARLAAAKASAENEEKRIAELKKVRGEKWLPSIAREMQRTKKWEEKLLGIKH
ncbi:uncharacterized protein LOC124919303 [Impatiens glandulifera]|uniref:uncharacterized protein LOC124919303 n=1 Tax=Impatiens glandulifera TaxID=253017 RepID=UPI001FB138EC|nr:uncharacterized protein LOC124919303 [Impatiens glandulifera]